MIGAPWKPLDTFPSEQVRAGTPLYRGHGSYGLWYFSSNARGRFNLPEDLGTCYFGLNRSTAVREVLRDELWDGATTTKNVDGRFVSTISAPRDVRVARAFDEKGESFGASNALSAQTTPPIIDDIVPIYVASRVWAMHFHRAGFEGIRYRSHYTLTDCALAIFGDKGARPSGDPAWPEDPAPEPLAATCARSDVGITVYAVRPASSTLTFV